MVKTSFVGEHWTNSVLAALLAGLSCRIDLERAAASLERVKPITARMQPVMLPSGAIVLRDEQNGSPDTLRAALKVFQESNALRRVLVMSDISDSQQRQRVRFRELGMMAAQTSDLAVFIGEHGYRAVKSACASGMSRDHVLSFIDLHRAAGFLISELRAGDFVLLRGRGTDHISRVVLAQLGNIGCWKIRCEKTIVCDLCPELKPEFDLGTMLQVI